jgi:uncharacterized membrane protein
MSRDPLARIAEKQTWLGPLERPMQEAVRSAFQAAGGKPLRQALHGSWLHEPLHAVLTDIPVGAWTASVTFDAIAAMGGAPWLDRAAEATLWVGIAGAAGSALTGLNDWAGLHGAPRRIGLVHGLLNTAGLALFIASAIARGRSGRGNGRALAALGYLVVSVSAHLGGNLVYEHGVGVSGPRSRPAPAEESQEQRGRAGTHPPDPFPEPPQDFTGESNDFEGFARERIKNKEMLSVSPKDVGF